MIILPWPPKELSPNARSHWSRKATQARNYRHQCKVLVHWTDRDKPADGPIAIHLTFRPPDRRARDLDNMLAAMKPGLDGLADALGVDDKRFALTLARGDPHKGGVIEVRILDPFGAWMAPFREVNDGIS